MSEPHPHRHLNASQGAALVAAWQRRQKGESRAVFCRRHAIGPWILKYWLTRLTPKDPSGFIQVIVPAHPAYIEVSVGLAQIRIHAGFDPVLLRDVVSCLSGTADEVEKAC